MKTKTLEKMYPLLTILGLVLLWESAVRAGWINAFSIPAPSKICLALFNQRIILLPHLWVTLLEGLLGIAFSILCALVISVLMNLSKTVKRAVYPLLVFSQTVPIIVLAPLLAMWFGFGTLPKIVVVTLVCFFPITVSITEGFAGVDAELIDLMRSMGANALQIFLKVKFPSALISFFSGLKIAATYSIMGAIIGEWMGGSAGLGVYMMRVKNSYAYDKMFAAILLISIISIIIFKSIEIVQRIAMPWNDFDKTKE